MDGTRRIGRASLGLLGADPAFTTDGRYAFSLASSGDVVAISTATGRLVRVPCAGCWDRFLKCQCQTVVPLGPGTVGWLDGTNHLVRADLAATPPAVRPSAATVPVWSNDWDEQVPPQLLAGTDGAVLAAYPGSLSDQPGPVYLVTPDGPPRQLAPGRVDSLRRAAFSPDGRRIALAGDEGPDPCATVTVVDVRTGAGTTSPVNAAPGTPCPTRDGYVGTLWWDGDGVLNAYFQAAGQDDVTNASQRRLEGDRWVAAGTEPTTQAHRLGGGATAVLSHPGVRDRDFLLLVADGRRTKIDGEVSRVAAAPRLAS